MNARIESGHVYTETLITKHSADAEAYLIEKLGRKPTLADYERYKITPDEVLEGPQPGNLLLNVGVNQLWARCATAEQVWDATHGAIGTGDSSTAASAGQTDLQAASNKYYQVWAGLPTTGASQAIVFQSTFATGNGNYAWNEYGVVIPDTGTAYTSGTTKQASYIMLNRKAGAGLLGTKTSAQSWTFTVTMTLA